MGGKQAFVFIFVLALRSTNSVGVNHVPAQCLDGNCDIKPSKSNSLLQHTSKELTRKAVFVEDVTNKDVTTEIIGAAFPVRQGDGHISKPSLLESTDYLSLATHTKKRETCFRLQGNAKPPPANVDPDGEQHLHRINATMKNGQGVELAMIGDHADIGRGMLCCDGTVDQGDSLDMMQCHRKPEVTSSLTEIPDRFIQTSLSDMSGGGLAEAADQIARVVREASARTKVFVHPAVILQVLSLLGDLDKQKVIERGQWWGAVEHFIVRPALSHWLR